MNHIYSDAIVLHFGSNTIGGVDDLYGMINDVTFRVYFNKETDYTKMIMLT